MVNLVGWSWQVEGAGVELGTRARLMEDRSRAGRWATNEGDKPLRGIPLDELREARPPHPCIHYDLEHF
jgi:hypothetical protein